MSTPDSPPGSPSRRPPRWSVGWRALAVAGSAVLLAMAFPPVGESRLAWVALAPLLAVARFTPPMRSLRWGFAGGFLFWLLSLAWLLRLSRTGTILPVAALAWAALSAYCAIYTGLFLAVVSFLFSGARERDSSAAETPESAVSGVRSVLLVCGVPLLWVGFEYLRSVLFTGFPWNQLGVSQYRNVGIIQLAEWGGVYAVSGVLMIMNLLVFLIGMRLAGMLRREPGARRWQPEVTFGLAVVLLLMLLAQVRTSHVGARSVSGQAVSVAVIQPNIEQRKKWVEGTEAEIYGRLDDQTELALASVSRLDLVVWPETVLPSAVNADPEALTFVKGLARDQAPLLAGSIEAIGEPQEPDVAKYYNSSFLFGRDADVLQIYRKRHLVIFGEYLPFDRFIPFLQRMAPLGFTCTPGGTSTVFRLPLLRAAGAGDAAGLAGSTGRDGRGREACFSVLICFEDTLPGLARESVRNGARFLVIQTNDAWFDPSPCSLQHVSHSVFRCVENRVPAVRAANTGVSCFIDRQGRIEDAGTLEQRDWDRCVTRYRTSVLAVEGPDMPLTFYARYGDLPFALPCGVLSLLGFALVARAEKRKNASNMRLPWCRRI